MKTLRTYLAHVPQQVAKRLYFSGWLLFGVSLLLPAFSLNFHDGDTSPLMGWECARAVLENLLKSITFGAVNSGGVGDNPLSWHLCALGNLCAIVAPILWFSVRRRQERNVVCLFYTIALSAALFQSINFDLSHWHVGYYLWTASFGMMAAGSLIRSHHLITRKTLTQDQTGVRPRTPEELAAERELHDYLRSH